MKDQTRTLLLVASGFLQLILSYFIPVGGGGVSIILALSIPILIGLGCILGIIYYVFIKKFEDQRYKSSFFYGMICIIVFLTFISYPYR